MFPHIQRIHLVGIGGIGMSGIAEVLLNLGYRVSGSDLKRSPLTDRLRRHGAAVRVGHRAENVAEADVVVVSSAVRPDNPEVGRARARGIPVIARGEMLAELMRLKYGVAVAGTHGKTTTTSLVGQVLDAGGLDPTLIVGGRVKNLRGNARLGKGEFLVAEADESDGSFLHLNPTVAVVTNIDAEHLDHYKDFATLQRTFRDFVMKIPFYGAAILCADHPVVRALLPLPGKRTVTYGLTGPVDLTATGIRRQGLGSCFTVRRHGKPLGRARLRIPGRHNVQNALAAVAVGLELRIPFGKIARGLAAFRGIARRFEILAERPYFLINDYGHHPVEIAATLQTARALWPRRRLVVAFQPHRYTRTRDLFDAFTACFAGVDQLYLTEIYPAGERPIQGVSGQALAAAVRKKQAVHFIPTLGGLAERLAREARPGDVVVTLGAGDISQVGHALARRGKRRS